ncbi:MAG: hypothetical protein ACO1QB_04795 [Verrucomicrobiales bacterium]
MKISFRFFALLLFVSTCSLRAVMVGPFPGLPKLIKESDAIAIVMIEEQISASKVTLDHWSSHRCLVLRSLKGDLTEGQRLDLKLLDTQFSFVSPFTIGSTHLVFLVYGPEGDLVFRNLQREGSILRLSPFGHEVEPAGPTLEQKIQNLLERSIAYWDGVQQREKDILLSIISGKISPLRRELERTGKGSAERNHIQPRYFLHFGFQTSVRSRRLLSTEIRVGEPFYAGAGDSQELSGLIELRGGKFHADIKGNDDRQGGFFMGSLTNGIPVFAQGGSFSGGWAPMWFALSTNAESSEILRMIEEAQVEPIWNELWNTKQKPDIDPLTAEEVKSLEGAWKCRLGVAQDLIHLSILPNHEIEITGEKEGQPWSKRGEWRIVKDKCVILLKEMPPNFIIQVKNDFFMFDPWAATMLSPLAR